MQSHQLDEMEMPYPWQDKDRLGGRLLSTQHRVLRGLSFKATKGNQHACEAVCHCSSQSLKPVVPLRSANLHQTSFILTSTPQEQYV